MVGRNRQREMLRNRIVSSVRPGMTLAELAKALGVSVAVVRPAVMALSVKGRLRVREVTIKTRRSPFDTRIVISPELSVQADFPAWMRGAVPPGGGDE